MFKLLENLVSTLNLEFYVKKFKTKKILDKQKIKLWRSTGEIDAFEDNRVIVT